GTDRTRAGVYTPCLHAALPIWLAGDAAASSRSSHGSTVIRSALRDSVRRGGWVAPAPEAAQRAPGAEADVGTPGAEVSPTLFPRLIASTDHAPAPKVASTRHPPRIIRLASQPGAWGP